METLSIKELAPYLPYKLMIMDSVAGKPKVMNLGQGASTNWIGIKTVLSYFKSCKDIYKPLLRPLSDLPKGHIDYIYFVIIGTDNDMYGSRDEFEDTLFELLGNPIHLPVLVYNYLLEKHFDLFNLIKRGKAIDLNTIKETVK